MPNKTKNVLVFDVLIVVINTFVLLFQYKQLVLHNRFLFVLSCVFIAFSVVALLVMNSTSKRVIIPRSDCIWIKGKIGIGVLSIAISIVLMVNYTELVSKNILLESIPLFVLG